MGILKTEALQWHEGMLLQPHHFQQNDLRLNELMAFHVSEISPFHWGLKHFKLDTTQLVAGKLVFLELEAVMPDGLVISKYAQDGEIIEADLTAYEEQLRENPLLTYLAVPRHVYGKGNAVGKLPRWISKGDKQVVDENTGDGEIDVATIAPNALIFVGEKPSSHFVCFPLFEIMLEDNVHKITSFSPPLLRVYRDSIIGELAQSINKAIRAKIVYLVEKLNHPTKFDLAKNLEESIQALSAGLLPFEAVLSAQANHPFDLYIRLCTLAGHIAGLNKQQVPPVFPTYNHNDLQKSFVHVCNFIQDMLERVQENHSTIKLTKVDNRFEIALTEEYMTNPYLVFGARVSSEMNGPDMVAWIEDAIISTASALEAAVESRILGARREVIDTEYTAGIASSKNVVLFRVYTGDRFTLAGEILTIFNSLQKPERAPAEVVLYIFR